MIQAGPVQQLYVGGSMVNIAAAATHSSGQQINMYHGVCSWGDGQLEGADAPLDKILAVLCNCVQHALHEAQL